MGGSVLWRGIRHRAGRSLTVLSLGAVSVLACALVPLYARAAEQSVLTDGLRAAPAGAIALTVTTEGSAQASPLAHEPVGEAQQAVGAALAGAPDLSTVLLPPVGGVETDTVLRAGDTTYPVRLAWRQAVCSHVEIDGACPIDAGEVMLSSRAAQQAGVAVGDTIRFGDTGDGSATTGDAAARGPRLEVVGVYTPTAPADPYWGRHAYFAQGAASAEAAVRLDAAFTGSEDDVRYSDAAVVGLSLQYLVDPGAVRLDDVVGVRADLAAVTAALSGDDLQVGSALPAVLDGVAVDQRELRRTVPVIAVPLLLLAFGVLFLTIRALVEERGPELALARLRGFPAGRAARFGLAETMLLLAVAAPLGLAGAVALVEVTARFVLAAGTHAEPRPPALVAAAAGLLGAIVAGRLAARRVLRRDVPALLRRVPARGGRVAGAVEAVAAVAALASVVAAVTDRGSPLALLAPAALAVVAGVVAGRLVVWTARAALASGRRRGRIPALLAGAQLGRRAGVRRTVAVLTASIALLSFAALAWDVSGRARADHAEQTVGASTVYAVSAAHPQALVAAVAKADPSGRSMAVVRTDEQYAGGRVELIGVQPNLAGQIARWPGGAPDLAALSPAGTAPAHLGSEVSVVVTDAHAGDVPVRFGALVAAPGASPRLVGLGTLVDGAHTYRADLPACVSGCRLVGFGFSRLGGDGPVDVDVAVARVASDGEAVPVDLTRAEAWRAELDRTPEATVTVTTGEPLRLAVTTPGSGDVVVSYLDTPSALPVVVAGTVPSPAGTDTFTFPGLADVPQQFTVAGTVPALPRAGTHGLLFDLDLAVRAASVTAGLADATDLRYEVWAAADAPADLAGRLSEQGVDVLRTETLAGVGQQLGRRAPALALRLFLLAGIAAAGLGLTVVALSLQLGAAERRRELAALRLTGVRPKPLRRALRRERWILLGVPLAVGLVAGVGAAALILPGVPLVVVDGPGVTDLTDLLPTAGSSAVPVVVGAALLVLVVAVVRSGAAVARSGPAGGRSSGDGSGAAADRSADVAAGGAR